MDEPSVCKITNTLLNDFAHNRLGNTSFRMNSNIEHDKKKTFFKANTKRWIETDNIVYTKIRIHGAETIEIGI